MACENADAATTALVNSVSKPLKVAGDAGSFEMHPIPAVIAALNHLAAGCAARKRRKGMYLSRMIPDGTVQRDRCYGPGGDWMPWR